MLEILIAAPWRPGTTSGNDVTARRWQRRLTELGHTASITEFAEGDELEPSTQADVIVALHARRTAAVVRSAKQQNPDRFVVVALTGTDLYRDLPDDVDARRSVELADACIVLQQAAVARLDDIVPAVAATTHVMHQSVEGEAPVADPPTGEFVVAVVAHLRDVKDPLLAAKAVRLLPETSTVRVVHAGHPYDDGWAAAARQETEENPRYHWLGPLSRPAALALIARSTVLANTSLLEGGANVVTEAIAIGVPVIGTNVEGVTGLMGHDHPGLFPIGDAAAMAQLLQHLDSSPKALEALRQRSRDRQPLTTVDRERGAWADLLAGLLSGESA